MKKFICKIPNNSPVIIHSDLLSFGKAILNKKDEIKKTFIKHFYKGVLIPSFILKKKKILRFDKFEHTMGALTSMFIKHKSFFRNVNPIHSYIFNKIKVNKEMFTNKSFGKDSIFNFFYEKNFIWINFGASNNEGFTLFHHAECICNVSYRKKVYFKRILILKRKKRQITYEYFARKKNILYNFDRAVKDMLSRKILKKIKIKKKRSIIYGKCVPIVDFLIMKINKNKNYLLK